MVNGEVPMFRLKSLVLLAAVVVGCGRTAPYRFRSDAGVAEVPPMTMVEPVGPALTCTQTESDLYTLPPMKRQPIDVLFVIDDSCSMKNDQEALAANFQKFISAFLTNEVDFHLGAVTTDMVKTTRSGRLVTPFLTSTTPDLSAAFDKMVNVGIKGSGQEQGIAAAHAALSEPLFSSTNSGFLRPGANLGLVFLSDENDQSPETVPSFISFLKGLKPDLSSVSVASIVGLQAAVRCTTANWRYVQVAEAFGIRGLVSSCNQDYAGTLRDVSESLIATRCIIGLRRAIEEGIRIRATVNGQSSAFLRFAPDGQYPNGSLALLLCPEKGGPVELIYEECQ
jgi:hypothetical protein